MMEKFESHSRIFALLTMVSRVTGLARDAAFSRVFGSDAFWEATLDGQHHPDTPEICRAYLELLACYFVLLGSIGFCLPLTRRRYKMFTEQ